MTPAEQLWTYYESTSGIGLIVFDASISLSPLPKISATSMNCSMLRQLQFFRRWTTSRTCRSSMPFLPNSRHLKTDLSQSIYRLLHLPTFGKVWPSHGCKDVTIPASAVAERNLKGVTASLFRAQHVCATFARLSCASMG